MIKIEHTNVTGFDSAIRGMRNPMNSWSKSDSHWRLAEGEVDYDGKMVYCIGENDLMLMKSLAKGGAVHAKYRRMINVTCDITAPLYWWKEFDTAKVGTVANSCSTMHKIHADEFTHKDFSCEHMIDDETFLNDWYHDAISGEYWSARDVLHQTILVLNFYRRKYLESNDKKYWWQMIQLLPSSYNQKRTVQLNYEVLTMMYRDRRFHKLDEWREFCEWIKALPYSELITGK